MALNDEQKSAISPLLGSFGVGLMGGMIGSSVGFGTLPKQQPQISPPAYQGNNVPGRGGLPDSPVSFNRPTPGGGPNYVPVQQIPGRASVEAGGQPTVPQEAPPVKPQIATPVKDMANSINDLISKPLMNMGAVMMQAGGWQPKPVDTLSVVGQGLGAFSATLESQAAAQAAKTTKQQELSLREAEVQAKSLEALTKAQEAEDKRKDRELAREYATQLAKNDPKWAAYAATDPEGAVREYTKQAAKGVKPIFTPFDEASAKNAAKLVSDIGQSAREAVVDNANITIFEQALNKVYTGFGGDAIKDLQEMLNFFGVQSEGLAAREVIQSLAFKMATAIKTPGAISNWEQQKFIEAVPGLTHSEAGNRILLRLYKKMNDHKIAMDQTISKAVAEGKANDPYFNPDEAFFNKIVAENPVFSSDEIALLDSVIANGGLPGTDTQQATEGEQEVAPPPGKTVPEGFILIKSGDQYYLKPKG